MASSSSSSSSLDRKRKSPNDPSFEDDGGHTQEEDSAVDAPTNDNENVTTTQTTCGMTDQSETNPTEANDSSNDGEGAGGGGGGETAAQATDNDDNNDININDSSTSADNNTTTNNNTNSKRSKFRPPVVLDRYGVPINQKNPVAAGGLSPFPPGPLPVPATATASNNKKKKAAVTRTPAVGRALPLLPPPQHLPHPHPRPFAMGVVGAPPHLAPPLLPFGHPFSVAQQNRGNAATGNKHNKQNTKDEPKSSVEVPLVVRGERLTLTQAALKLMYPTKGARLLDAMRQSPGASLTYSTEPAATKRGKSSNTLQKYADDLDKFLFTTSGGNAETAAAILKTFLRRPNVAPIKECLSVADLRPGAQRKLQSETKHASVDSVIVQGLVDFLYSHRTISARRKHEQVAVDAVLTAACSAQKRYYRSHRKTTQTSTKSRSSTKQGRKRKRNRKKNQEESDNHDENESDDNENDDDDEDNENENDDDNQNDGHDKNSKKKGRGKISKQKHTVDDDEDEDEDDEEEEEQEEFPLEEIAARLGKSPQQLALYRKEMAGKLFEPRKEMTREDYYNINPVAACVVEFCHSDEASWFVSDNENAKYASKPVVNPVTLQHEEHRLRLWHEPILQDRYAVFLRSTAYHDYLARQREQQQQHADTAEEEQLQTIDLETFQKYTCKCVREFHPKGRGRKIKRPPKPVPPMMTTATTTTNMLRAPPGEEEGEGQAFFHFLQTRDRYVT